MKILVCVKQVPESEAAIRIDQTSQWIQIERSSSFRMNRFDEFAVEEALLIKGAFPGTTVDAITVGPERTAMTLKRAMGMGADHGIHIVRGEEGYISPFLTAYWMASYARERDYGLILAGVMSEDYMQCQVGPMLAEYLSLPCATSVISRQFSSDLRRVYVEREIEGGFRDTLDLGLPALITLQSGINRPRYPSLSNMLRAKKQEMEIIQADSLGHPEPRQEVIGMSYPSRSRSGLVLDGTQEEKARKLLMILREKSLIH
jgi:electron transfer flavoprotein beta subunit